MELYGTSFFKSLAHAEKYYASYYPDATKSEIAACVQHKIEEKEISIGKPEISKGGILFTDPEGRYHIQTKD